MLLDNEFAFKNVIVGDFPGGPEVKNLPTNAGDTSSIPGPGRSHRLLSNWVLSHNYLSLGATTAESTCLEPVLCNKRDHSNEKPLHHN